MSDHSPTVHQASTFSDLPASSHMSSDLFGLGLQGLCVMVLVDQEIQSSSFASSNSLLTLLFLLIEMYFYFTDS